MPATIDHAFAALSHTTRRSILARLMQGPASVTELAAAFTVSLPAISKHLDVLEEANLLVRVKIGRTRLCYLQPEPLQAAAAWLEEYRSFWEAQLDSLELYLEQTATAKAPAASPESKATKPGPDV